jgi:hypothetical protein
VLVKGYGLFFNYQGIFIKISREDYPGADAARTITRFFLPPVPPPPFTIQIFSTLGGHFAIEPCALVKGPDQGIHSDQQVLIMFHKCVVPLFSLREYYIFPFFLV